MWILETISFACVQCGCLTNPFISECACVGVCVYLSGITHSFQTCLSSTLVCFRECVWMCTLECEIPLSVLKPSLAYCLLRDYTHTHAQLSHLCMCLFFCAGLCVCVSFWRGALSGDGGNFLMYISHHQQRCLSHT